LDRDSSIKRAREYEYENAKEESRPLKKLKLLDEFKSPISGRLLNLVDDSDEMETGVENDYLQQVEAEERSYFNRFERKEERKKEKNSRDDLQREGSQRKKEVEEEEEKRRRQVASMYKLQGIVPPPSPPPRAVAVTAADNMMFHPSAIRYIY